MEVQWKVAQPQDSAVAKMAPCQFQYKKAQPQGGAIAPKQPSKSKTLKLTYKKRHLVEFT